MNKESYMHFYAKKIIMDWLISAWRYNREKGYNNKLYIFEWAINCSDKNFGIRVEYPILSKTRSDGGKIVLGIDTIWEEYPNMDKLASDVKVEAVLDLAIIDNGKIKYGIEVVHKHLCTESKRQFLKKCNIEVYEISAEWVMGQLIGDIPPKKWPILRV